MYNDGFINHYNNLYSMWIALKINPFRNYFSTTFAGFLHFSFLCIRFKKNSVKTKKR